MEKTKIILDCDPGHDDAVAIILAGKNPAMESTFLFMEAAANLWFVKK